MHECLNCGQMIDLSQTFCDDECEEEYHERPYQDSADDEDDDE